MEKSSFQLIIGEQNEKTQNRRIFANKYHTFLVVLSLTIIFTIGFGYAFFKKMIGEMENLSGRLSQDKNLISQLTENIKRMDEQIRSMNLRLQDTESSNKALEKKLTELPNHQDEYLKVENEFQSFIKQTKDLDDAVSTLGSNVSVDVIRRMNDIIQNVSHTTLENARSIEATKAVNTTMLTGFMNMSTEIEKISQRMDKNENDGQKQDQNMKKRIDTLEATKNVLENKVESLERTRTTAKVVWKFDKYNESTIIKPDSQEEKLYYGPTFYTNQFGYKMQLSCALLAKAIAIHIRVITGEYDDLLKWPFSGKITFIAFDQSQQKKDFTISFADLHHKSSECRQTWEKPLVNTGQTTPCGTLILSNEQLQSGNYIRNNTLFLGIEVESYK